MKDENVKVSKLKPMTKKEKFDLTWLALFGPEVKRPMVRYTGQSLVLPKKRAE